MEFATTPTHDEITELAIRRERLAGQINALNPTAGVEWLGRFDDGSLRDYLDRLERLAHRRGPTTRWERKSARRAVESRIPDDN